MDEDDIAYLLKRLYSAQIASCNCMTKTPDISYHDDKCPYKLYVQAQEAILQLSATALKDSS